MEAAEAPSGVQGAANGTDRMVGMKLTPWLLQLKTRDWESGARFQSDSFSCHTSCVRDIKCLSVKHGKRGLALLMSIRESGPSTVCVSC